MKIEEVQLRFDYAALDTETRAFVQERAERIHNLARMTAAGIVQIGQYLTEVKARLKHGQFLEWIGREFAWKHDSATRFMNVYDCFKLRNLRNLEIDISALYLIAAPKTPEPVRKEAIRRAENGEPVTHAGARALVKRFEETGELPTVEVCLPELIEECRPPAAPSEPTRRRTTDERQEEQRIRQERDANTVRMASVMAVIESIERIADTSLSMPEVAQAIERFDTPDKDWPGRVREANSRLKKLSAELKI